ncbi:MAG: YoaK family protein [Solirubrobacteraceae bacterium]|jgi:uncharacterized membrane protein YoaK (UPF0700 family)
MPIDSASPPPASPRGCAQPPPVASVRNPLTRALLALTLTTGFVDAASYLGIGHVFAANMTGNIVLLGFGLAGAGGLPVIAPLVSLAAFLLGAGAGGVLATGRGQNRRAHLTAALSIEALLVAGAAVLAVAVHVRPATVAGDGVIALLALGMGVRNATARKVAVPDLTTTVLTMTLTGLAADSRPAGGTGAGTSRRVAAVAAMLVGALGGALLLKTSLGLVLVVAFGLTVATLLAYRAASDT